MAFAGTNGIYFNSESGLAPFLDKIAGVIDEKAKDRKQLRGLSEGNIGGALGSTMLTPGTAPPPSMLDRLFNATGYGDSAPGPQQQAALPPQVPAQSSSPAPVRPMAYAPDDIRSGIASTAQALGINPADLATAISYETGGTFDPTKAGPVTQWGQHRGLIQFGQPQAAKYGVDWNNPVASQLGPDGAIAKYLTDAGVKPGMGLMDIYSAINAGRVGRNGASDAANGGAPGTVADKVNQQMANHRANALRMFGNMQPAPAEAGGNAMAYAPGAPQSPAAQAIAQAAPMPPQRPADLPREDGAPAPVQVAQAGPPTGLGAVNIPALIKNPATRALGLQLWQQMLAPKDGFTLKPGEQRFDSRGRPIASVAEKPESFSLSQGQSRFDASGRVVASVPKDDKEVKWQTYQRPDGSTGVFNPEDPSKTMVLPGAPANYRPATEEERKAYGVGPQTPFFFGPDNKPATLAGGTTVNVENKTESELQKLQGKGIGDRLNELASAGDKAAEDSTIYDRLGELMKGVQTGGWTNFTESVRRATGGAVVLDPKNTDNVQAMGALVQYLAPRLRVPGSGAQSDKELGNFLQSIPSLSGTPGGNKQILDTLSGSIEHRKRVAAIAQQWQVGDISAKEAYKQISSLPSPYAAFKDKPGTTPGKPAASTTPSRADLEAEARRRGLIP